LEAGTAGAKAGTGSKTIADLLPLAAERYADKPAIKRKVGEDWADISYEQLGITVKEVALGLIELDIQPGERVSILAHTRPEWSYACFGILSAGATAVTIYQTNSPEECHYVLEHSESRAVFVEDAEQLAKIRKVEDRLPNLEHVVVMEPDGADLGDAVSLDDLRQRGREADEARYDQRYTNTTPDDV
jgi:long-chain acyl-CoA synthetase